MNKLIEGFEEIENGKERFIKCGLCGVLEPRSIIPHMKLKHPDEWLEAFKKLRAGGASFKEIMWESFGFPRLSFWDTT